MGALRHTHTLCGSGAQHSRTPNKYDVILPQSFKVNLIYQSSAFRIKMSYLKVFDLLHCFVWL